MGTGIEAQMEELFAVVDGVSIRRMFGGLGMFRQGLMFALVADNVLYMKADAATSPAYEAEGCSQWVYAGKTRPVPMPYWQLPERLYDEPDEFREWALKAFAVARQGPKAKAKQSAKKPEPAPGKDATAGRKGAKPPRQKAPAKRPPRKSPAGKQN